MGIPGGGGGPSHGLAGPAASETEILPGDPGQPCAHQTPSTRSEIHRCALPRIRWSWRTRLSALQAWASWRVKSRSPWLGDGSPLGWVWKATIPAAPMSVELRVLGEQLLAPGAAQQVLDLRRRQRQHLGDGEDVGGDASEEVGGRPGLGDHESGASHAEAAPLATRRRKC